MKLSPWQEPFSCATLCDQLGVAGFSDGAIIAYGYANTAELVICHSVCHSEFGRFCAARPPGARFGKDIDGPLLNVRADGVRSIGSDNRIFHRR